MKQLIGMALAVVVLGPVGLARAADDNANAVLDKAIKALGGEQKLKAGKAVHWKSKGKISFGGSDNDFTSEATAQGLDHYRSTFEGEFNGNKVKGVSVLSGDKGWRQFGDNSMEMDKNALTNEKRTIYLQVVPLTLVPLKDKGFKVKAAGEEKVGDRPAACLQVTGPDGKDFKIYFDKESGLPVKLVAKVVGFMGEEFTQETTYTSYKDFKGIKAPTKMETKRDGENFIESEITTFEVLDKVDANTFAKP